MGELSVRIVMPIDIKKLCPSINLNAPQYPFPVLVTYPNVAAEPIIYCPSVRNMPLGPGPYRIIFVAPKMKPMINPTAGIY
jgi:hypothetical protein